MMAVSSGRTRLARQRRFRKLAVEALEPRRVLAAGFPTVVDTVVQRGEIPSELVTLTEAIQHVDANGGVVTFDPTVFPIDQETEIEIAECVTGEVDAECELFVIQNSVIVTADSTTGSPSVKLKVGDFPVPFFDVSGALTLNGIKIAHRGSTVIFNTGSTILNDSVIVPRSDVNNSTSNETRSLLVNGAQSAFLSNDSVNMRLNNTKVLGPESASLSLGRALDNYGGQVTIENQSEISRHKNAQGSGGALVTIDGDVTITDSKFEENSARAGSGGEGGGAWICGGTFHLQQSLFHKNEAEQSGGGIYVTDDCDLDSTSFEGLATLDIVGSVLSENKVSEGDGGGLYASDVRHDVANDGDCNVTGQPICIETIVHIKALESDDGTPPIPSYFSANTANNFGGGIFTLGELHVDKSYIESNVATGLPPQESSEQSDTIFGHGGGIYVGNVGRLEMTESFVRYNRAEHPELAEEDPDFTLENFGQGGGIYNAEHQVRSEDEDDPNQFEIWVDIQDSEISHNYALSRGGGIYNAGQTACEDAVKNDNIPCDSVATIATFEGQSLVDEPIPPADLWLEHTWVRENESNGEGGGIYNEGRLHAIGATLAENVVKLHASIEVPEVSFGGGGLLNKGIADIRYSALFDNEAFRTGGAIDSASSLTIASSTISNNSAVDLALDPADEPYGRGGGIYNRADIEIRDSTLYANQSAFPSGGALYDVSLPAHHTVRRNSVFAGSLLYQPPVAVQPNEIVDIISVSSWDDDFVNFIGKLSAIDDAIDPVLGQLQDNDGPSLSHLPLPGSPLIDNGVSSHELDQRGSPRVVNSIEHARPLVDLDTGPDIGSVEAQLFAVTDPLDAIDGNIGDGFADLRLRSAINEANALYGPSTLWLHTDSTLTLDGIDEDSAMTGDLDITQSLTIHGEGHTVDADQLDRVFDVHGNKRLTLVDVKVTGGKAAESNGGAIRARSQGSRIELIRSELKGNEATVADPLPDPLDQGRGGAVYAANAHVDLYGTTIAENQAYQGAGLAMHDSALSAVNSTIAVNEAEDQGGAIWSSSAGLPAEPQWKVVGHAVSLIDGLTEPLAPVEAGKSQFVNVTVARNDAALGGGLHSDGQAEFHGKNTIVGGNFADAVSDVVLADWKQPALAKNHVALDPVLGMLADSLGPTRVILPLNGSPVPDAGVDGGFEGFLGVPIPLTETAAYDDTVLTVGSTTGLPSGESFLAWVGSERMRLEVDGDELRVLDRALRGTAARRHPAGANVVVGLDNVALSLRHPLKALQEADENDPQFVAVQSVFVHDLDAIDRLTPSPSNPIELRMGSEKILVTSVLDRFRREISVIRTIAGSTDHFAEEQGFLVVEQRQPDPLITERFQNTIDIGSPETIATPGPAVSISIDDVAIKEGTGGDFTEYQFTVSLSTSPTGYVSFDYKTMVDGREDVFPAQPHTDYVPVAPTTLTFDPREAETTKTVSVMVPHDSTIEASETFLVVLENAQYNGQTSSLVDFAKDTGVGTIVNDDARTVSFLSSPPPLGEDSTGDFQFTLSVDRSDTPDAEEDITVVLAATGSAALGSDYTLSPGLTVVIPADQTSVVVTADIINDAIVELDEQLILTIQSVAFDGLVNPCEVQIGEQHQATATIENEDVTLLDIVMVQGSGIVEAFEANEGDAGDNPFRFKIRSSHQISQDVTVQIHTVDGTAFAHTAETNDYAAIPAGTLTVTIDAGELLSNEFSVIVSGDEWVEFHETFDLALSNPTFAGLGMTNFDPIPVTTANGTVTILNDDIADLQVHRVVGNGTTASLDVAEGDEGTTSYSFVITTSKAPAEEMTVTLNLKELAAETAKTDSLGRAREHLDFLPFSNPITVTIPAELKESNTFVVTIVGDQLVEKDEIFHVELSAPTYGAPPVAPESHMVTLTNGTVKIIDDDVANLTILRGSLSADLKVDEADPPEVTDYDFVVFTDRLASQDITVKVKATQIADSQGDSRAKAKIDEDFEDTGFIEVTILAGQTKSNAFEVGIIGDLILERPEFFEIVMSDPEFSCQSALGVSRTALNTATVEIIDNDEGELDVRLAATPTDPSLVVLETDTNQAHGFVIYSSKVTEELIEVQVSSSDLTAKKDDDYIPPTGQPITVQILPGEQQSAPFSITIVGDLIVEGDEQFKLELDNPKFAGEVPGDKLTTVDETVTIDDNDVAALRLRRVIGNELSGDFLLDEGQPSEFPAYNFVIESTNEASQDITVTTQALDRDPVDAESGIDYQPLPGQPLVVSIAAGETQSAPFVLTIIGDAIREPDEMFDMRLTDPTFNGSLVVADLVTTEDAIITIKDDDEVKLVIRRRLPDGSLTDDLTLPEGAKDTQTQYTFVVFTEGAPLEDVTVKVEAKDLPAPLPPSFFPGAEIGVDYLGIPNAPITATIAAGEHESAPFTLTVLGDDLVELEELFLFEFTEPTFGGEDATSAQVLLDTNYGVIDSTDTTDLVIRRVVDGVADSDPSLLVSEGDVVDDTPVETAYEFVVYTEHIAELPIKVKVEAKDLAIAQALRGTDYLPIDGAPLEVTIPAGETQSNVFTTTVVGDVLVEKDEDFVLAMTDTTLGGLSGEEVDAIIGQVDGQVTIDNDDIADLHIELLNEGPQEMIRVIEEDSGETAHTFVVAMTLEAAEDITIDVAALVLAGNNATFDVDFKAIPGAPKTVTLTKGSTVSDPFEVKIVGDTLLEADESFSIPLTNPKFDGETLAAEHNVFAAEDGTVTIEDNEAGLIVVRRRIGDDVQPDYVVPEGPPSGDTLHDFDLFIDTVAQEDITVTVVAQGLTAVEDEDFRPLGSEPIVVKIVAGQSTSEDIFKAAIIGDNLVEGRIDESFQLVISDIKYDGQIDLSADITSSDATVLIRDNDVADLRLHRLVDSAPSTDLSVVEGLAGEVAHQFVVHSSNPISQAITLAVHPMDFGPGVDLNGDGQADESDDLLKAEAGIDYLVADNPPYTLTILSNEQTSNAFTLTIVGDKLVENDEQLQVTLADPTFGGIAAVTSEATVVDAAVTILNDDDPTLTVFYTPPVGESGPPTVSETGGMVKLRVEHNLTDLSQPIEAALSSSNVLKGVVAQRKITIPSGVRTSDEFSVHGIDDIAFGDTLVDIKAAQDGFVSEEYALTIHDHEPHQYTFSQLDSNFDGVISPVDVLLVINALNASEGETLVLSTPRPSGTPSFLDINGDEVLSPVDALLVINFLNQHAGNNPAVDMAIELGASEVASEETVSAKLTWNLGVQNAQPLAVWIEASPPGWVEILQDDQENEVISLAALSGNQAVPETPFSIRAIRAPEPGETQTINLLSIAGYVDGEVVYSATPVLLTVTESTGGGEQSGDDPGEGEQAEERGTFATGFYSAVGELSFSESSVSESAGTAFQAQRDERHAALSLALALTNGFQALPVDDSESTFNRNSADDDEWESLLDVLSRDGCSPYYLR